MTQNQGNELGWNDTIQNDGEGFTILPEGEYAFTVTAFERGRHPGSDKLPPCNKAILTLKVEGEGGSSTIKQNLFLHTITEGLLCQFFRAIGARQHGEKLVMDWNKVTGAKGRCKVTVRSFTGRSGDKMESNEVRFLDPEEGNAQPTAPGGKNWKAGDF